MTDHERPRLSAAAGRVSPARRALGGSVGNGRLTALAGAVLLVLLAVEGATVLRIGQLLSVHIPLMRFLVAPVLVFSTLTLFGAGVALLLVPHGGTVLMLHKASFIVWVGATSIHVLAYSLRSGRLVLAEVRGGDGRGLRLGAVLLALAGGAVLAVATYPLAHPWLHRHGFSFGR